MNELTRYENTRETSLGTAEWASRDQWNNHSFQTGDLFLSRTIDETETAIGQNDDRHVLLVSGSRGGKGTTVIINNLCFWQGSAIVVDPKGENAIVTARRRGQGSEYCHGMGQRVRILDPFNTAKREDDDFADLKARFNPLDAIDANDEEAVDEAGRIADALVVVQATSDPFWEESARSLIRGLILHVLTDAQFEEQRNLVTVRNLITRGDWIGIEGIQAINLERGSDGIEPLYVPENPFDLLWAGMADNLSHEGIVAGVGNSFANMSEKARDSILQVANRNTEFIDSPGMRRSLEASDFQLSELKTAPEGSTVYLTLPQRYMNTHFRWLRMMITLTVTEMEQVKSKPATNHPTLMILDEFAGLKKMDVIENATAQIAGFGVKLLFVVQSLVQLKETYKENWEVFLANSGTKLFFNIDDGFSRDYISKYLGETEISRSTATSSFSENVSRSTSNSNSSSRSGSQNSSHSITRNRGLDLTQMFSGTKSDGSTSGTSQSTSTSTSTSSSFGSTTTTGTSETLHKRPLITPDEIGRYFARVDDKNDASYPGLLIASVSGAQPLVLRKSNYFEDRDFRGAYDPHPDHSYPPKMDRLSEILLLEQENSEQRMRDAAAREEDERQAAKVAAEAQRKADNTAVIVFLIFLLIVLALIIYIPAIITHEVVAPGSFSLGDAFVNYPYLSISTLLSSWKDLLNGAVSIAVLGIKILLGLFVLGIIGKTLGK